MHAIPSLCVLELDDLSFRSGEPGSIPRGNASMKYPRWSIRILLVVTAAFGIGAAWISDLRNNVAKDNSIAQELSEAGIDITARNPDRSFLERATGVQVRPSRHRVILSHNQHQYLYRVSKLACVEELEYMPPGGIPNLMVFKDFNHLKILRIEEWGNPEYLDGVQDLVNLEVLEIGNPITYDSVDLTPLKNHPSLKQFSIGSYQLDPKKDFQEFPDW